MNIRRVVAGRRGALALVLGMVLLAAGLAGCGGSAGQSDPLAVATVNGHAISLADYETVLALYKAGAVRQGQGQDWQNPSSRANLKTTEQEALDFLTNLEIAREQLKHPVTQAQIQAQSAPLVQVRGQFAQRNQDAATKALAKTITPRAIELLAEQAAIQNALIQQQSVPTFHLYGILVNTLVDAQQLEQQAQHGANFGQLAHDHSLDSASAAQNGDLGTVYPGQYGTQFDATAFGSGATRSQPASNAPRYVIIPLSGAYALFELTEPGTAPLKSISDTQTQQGAFNGWLSDIVRPHATIQQNIIID